MCIVIHPILRALYGLFTGATSSSSAARVTVSPPLAIKVFKFRWVVGWWGNCRNLHDRFAARITAACDRPFGPTPTPPTALAGRPCGEGVAGSFTQRCAACFSAAPTWITTTFGGETCDRRPWGWETAKCLCHRYS